MGKASRRQRRSGGANARPTPVPFIARPFAGLRTETQWVALREILPAATATVRLRAEYAAAAPAGLTYRIATVLPMAWPGLHRADGTVYAATQSGNSSGDPSRDLAAQLLAAAALDPGQPLVHAPTVNAGSPRLQDVLEDAPLDVEVHEGFDFWVEGQDLDATAQESLTRANEAAVPTTALTALPSAYHVIIGDRAFVRLVLADDEDCATDALARLSAAGSASLGDGTRLLGAFRACGLLVPVWEVDITAEPAAGEPSLIAFGERYAAALAQPDPLNPAERRARAGLLSRQVTLR